MDNIISASYARLVTESHGCVSPVKIIDLPDLVSNRYANESKYGCTCSAFVDVTSHLFEVYTNPSDTSFAFTEGGFLGKVPPLFS